MKKRSDLVDILEKYVKKSLGPGIDEGQVRSYLKTIQRKVNAFEQDLISKIELPYNLLKKPSLRYRIEMRIVSLAGRVREYFR